MLALLCLSFVAGALGAPTSCNQVCSAVYSPVCGSNGQTYSSYCLLDQANCLVHQLGGGQGVSMLHSGICRGGILGGGYPGVSSSCDQFCDEAKSPICASDGVVYDNRCLYERARCEAARNRTNLSIVSFTSTCPTPIEPSCEKYSVNTSDIAVEGQQGGGVKILCPHGGHEVCTNHGTYQSECQLCQAIDATITRYQHLSGYKVPEYKILYESPCHGASSSYPGGPFLGGSGFPIDPMVPKRRID